MPDLLREQFPFFRPIVEAFGYRNLEFEGWEADDVIATLATRADEAGVKTCIVSTDRDAFQLVTDNVTLMMTPRGVQEVNVYTPERVEARLGITPDKVPDFIGLKGDPSDNIEGVPGIGDKTAVAADPEVRLARGGARARRRADPGAPQGARPSTPTRRATRRCWRRCAAISTSTATRRSWCSRPRTAPSSREMFRRFEFRGLLQRVDLLDEALPAAAPREVKGEAARRGAKNRRQVTLCYKPRRGTRRTAAGLLSPRNDGVVVVPKPAGNSVLQGVVVHDAKALRVAAKDDTLLAAYLIEPGRATYELDDLAAEYGVGVTLTPEADEETAALVRRAALPPRLISQMRARLLERGNLELYETIELPLLQVLADMEDAGVRIDTYRMGEITARLQDRIEELESKAYELAGEEFMLGSTQQVARILFEKLALTPGRKGKTGYSTDTRVLRTIREEHEIVAGPRGVARAHEARQHVPRPAADPDRRGQPPAHDLQPGGRGDRPALDEQPEPAGDPDPDRARP